MVVDKKMVDMELDIVADMAADKKMADMELDMVANIQIGKVADMFNIKCIKPECSKTKCIGPKLFDAKCTRLACLLSFAGLFTARLSLADVKHCFQSPTKCILLKYRDCSAVTKRTILIILIILD